MPSDPHMSAIVERLRVPVMFHSNPAQTNAERREAADLIDRLAAPVGDMGLETTEEERKAWFGEDNEGHKHWRVVSLLDARRLLDDFDRLHAALAAANMDLILAEGREATERAAREKVEAALQEMKTGLLKEPMDTYTFDQRQFLYRQTKIVTAALTGATQ